MKKKAIIVLVLFIGFTKLQAQFLKDMAVYATGVLEIGNYFGGNLNANYIHHNDYSLSLGISGYSRTAQNIPKELAEHYYYAPNEVVSSLHLLGGKIFKFKKSGKTRLNLLGGFGYSSLSKYSDWVQSERNGEYGYDRSVTSTVSFVLNPRIEFPFTKMFGLMISPSFSINKHTTVIGIGAGMMFGKTRNDY